MINVARAAMPKSSARTCRAQRGLTLIEIVVVLIILGLIMSVIGGRVLGAGDKAKADLTKLKIKDISASIEQFQLRYNTLPPSLNALVQCTAETGPDCVPITNEDSLKDAWGNPFHFALAEGGRSFKLTSLGADGREGGSGVDSDFSGTGP